MTTVVPPSAPLERAGSWLDREYYVGDEQLGLIRALYCEFVLFVIDVPAFTWIANSPQLLFDPPLLSVANLLSGWPSYELLWILSVALVVLYLLLLFGFFVPTVSVVISLLLIAGSSLQFSLGKSITMSCSCWCRWQWRAPGGESLHARAGVGGAKPFGPLVGGTRHRCRFRHVHGPIPEADHRVADIRTHASYGQLIYSFYSDARDGLLAPFPSACPVPRPRGRDPII